jgi:hypothetical protein
MDLINIWEITNLQRHAAQPLQLVWHLHFGVEAVEAAMDVDSPFFTA